MEVETAPLEGVDATLSTLTSRLSIGAVLTLLMAATAVAIRRGLGHLHDMIAVADGEREQRILTDDG